MQLVFFLSLFFCFFFFSFSLSFFSFLFTLFSLLFKHLFPSNQAAFSSIHSRDVLLQLSPNEHIGELDPKDQSAPPTHDNYNDNLVKEWKEKRKKKKNLLPSLNKIVNLFDFEVLAKGVMGEEGWGLL